MWEKILNFLVFRKVKQSPPSGKVSSETRQLIVLIFGPQTVPFLYQNTYMLCSRTLTAVKTVRTVNTRVREEPSEGTKSRTV